jgi:hypothetical protein
MKRLSGVEKTSRVRFCKAVLFRAAFYQQTMSGFDALIKFVAKEDQESYFGPITYRKVAKSGAQLVGTAVVGYASVDHLRWRAGGRSRIVEKVRFEPISSPLGSHVS